MSIYQLKFIEERKAHRDRRTLRENQLLSVGGCMMDLEATYVGANVLNAERWLMEEDTFFYPGYRWI
jgi:hypothetical protein